MGREKKKRLVRLVSIWMQELKVVGKEKRMEQQGSGDTKPTTISSQRLED